MPRYDYIVQRPDGTIHVGWVDAVDLHSAYEQVNLLGGDVLHCEPKAESVDELAGQSPSPGSPHDSQVNPATELWRATRSRLPLEVALQSLAEDLPQSRLRRGLLAITEQLTQGQPLDQAVAACGPFLPRALQSYVRIGMQIGDVPGLLTQFMVQRRQRLEQRARLALAWFYPLILLAGVAVVVSFLLGYVGNEMRRIFEDFGTELPLLTLWVIKLTQLLRSCLNLEARPLLVLAAISVISLATFAYIRRQPGLRGFVQHLFRSIPGIGVSLRLMSWSQYASLLAHLVTQHTPLAKAVQLAGSVSDDESLVRAGRTGQQLLESGLSADELLRQLPLFPPEIARALQRSQSPEQLAGSLRSISQVYVARAEAFSVSWLGLIEPLATVLAGLSVGLILVAWFLPLFKLLNDLS